MGVTIVTGSLAAALLEVQNMSLLEALKKYEDAYFFGISLVVLHLSLYLFSIFITPDLDNRNMSCLMVPLKNISHFVPQVQQQNLVLQVTNLYQYKLANEQSLAKVALLYSSMKQVSSRSLQPLLLGNGTEKTLSVLHLAIAVMLQDKNSPRLLPPVP